MSFKPNQKVTFVTHRGRSGTGRFERTRQTEKGEWVDVVDDSTGKTVSVRPASVTRR